MFLLSQKILIFVANKQRWSGTWGFTLETFTRSSHGTAVSISMRIPSGCKAHRRDGEEHLPPLFFRFWVNLTRNQSRLNTLTLAKSRWGQQ